MSVSRIDKTGASTPFGQWLSRQRKTRDFTQEDLAERLGCSVWSIQKIEVGNRRPSKQIAEIMADFFSIPAGERAAFLLFARGQAEEWERSSGEQTLRAEPQPKHDAKGAVGPGTVTHPSNLPVQLTSFVGRVVELPRIFDLLLTSEVRLLTLTGPPGTGKTRLALQVAGELLKYPDFADGVFFINLAHIEDPSLVIPEIAQTLDLRAKPTIRSTGVSPLEGVKEYLKDKRLLLVLDNFEHVVEAAPVAGELLSAAPKVKVMITSRVPLHIRGEKEFAVPPLQLPDTEHLPTLDRLGRYEAVRLFLERAVDVNDNFKLTDDNATAVAQICAQLDGLPLAIELAAARVKFLSPQNILTRLKSRLELLTGGPRDMPARQRTLRCALEWSYELLDDEEKRLFRRLAVFRSGGTLEAIEAVCNGRGDLQVDVLEGVRSLIDNSLLRKEETANGEPRFIMLETIHEYATEKLEESGEAKQVQGGHSVYFMRLAEEAEPHLKGPEQQEWLDRLEEEHDNLRSALQWARESDDEEAVVTGLRLGGALWQFWAVRGYLNEGWAQLSGLLKAAHARSVEANEERGLKERESPIYKASRAKALNGAGILADLLGDYVSARSVHEEGLALRRELGDKKGIAASLNNLGSLAQQQGDYVSASALYEESLALKRELGDDWSVAISLSNLGLVAQQQGDYVAARSLYEESLNLARELGDKAGIAISLNNLGLVAHLQGDYTSARSLYEESLALKRELGDKRGAAISLSNLGLVAVEQGDYTPASSRFEESLTLRRELGDKWGIALSLAGLGGVAVALGSASYSRSSAIGETGEAGEIGRGVRLLGVVEALLESIGAVLEAEDRLPYERAVASARALLGAEEFERLWALGRAMTMEQGIEYALRHDRA